MIEGEKDVKTNAEDTSSTAHSTEDAQPNEADAENSQKSENSEEEKEPELKVDYAAELVKMRESRDREKTIAREERRKNRESKPTTEDETEEETPDIDAKLDAIRREQAEYTIEEELELVSEDPHERALIREIYDTRFADKRYNRRAIRENLEDAKFLANKPLFKAQLFARAKSQAKEEIRREMVATNSSGGSSTRREPMGNTQKLNADERALLDFAKRAAKRGT